MPLRAHYKRVHLSIANVPLVVTPSGVLFPLLLCFFYLCVLCALCVNRFFCCCFFVYFNNIFGRDRISIVPRSSVSV